MALVIFFGKTPAVASIAVNDFAGAFIAKRSDVTMTYGANNKIATISVAKTNCARLGKVVSKSVVFNVETDKSENINYNASYSVSSKHSLDLTMLQSLTIAEFNDIKRNTWVLFLASDVLLDAGTPVATLTNLGGSLVTSLIFDQVTFTGSQKRTNGDSNETALKFEMMGKGAEEAYIGEALTITLT